MTADELKAMIGSLVASFDAIHKVRDPEALRTAAEALPLHDCRLLHIQMWALQIARRGSMQRWVTGSVI